MIIRDKNSNLRKFSIFVAVTLALLFLISAPLLNLVYDSSDTIVFPNATEGSPHGARMDASVLFMDFDDAPEGTYVRDGSVENNYGEEIGNVIYDASCDSPAGGGCYSFEGVQGDRINVSDSSTLQPTDAVSVSAWVKLADKESATGNVQGIISTFGNAKGNQYGYGLLYHEASNYFYFAVDEDGGGDWKTADGDADIDANTWYHVVGVMDGSEVSLYINGTKQSTTATCTKITYDSSSWTFFGTFQVG